MANVERIERPAGKKETDDPKGTFIRCVGGDYVSMTQTGSPSPAYRVVQAALRRIGEGGDSFTLPDGYGLDTLRRVSWNLGFCDQPVRVSVRQAEELAQMAEELLEADGGGSLIYSEKEAAVSLLRTVRWVR